MIKFIDILNESTRVKMDPDFKRVLNNVVDIIFKKRKIFKKYTPITTIPIMVADGTSGQVEIIVDPNLPSYGLMDTKVEDSVDPNDFIMSINPKMIQSKKGLYQTLYHEILHATDPNFSTKYNEKYWSDYDPELDEKYWGHPVEFRAITNEFIEGLINEFVLRRKRIKNSNSIKSLINSLDNILNYFSSGEPLNSLSKNIIHSMYGGDDVNNNIKKSLENILVDNPELLDIVNSSYEKLDYINVLDLVKKYSGDDWKRFLSMLVKASDEIRDSLK
jgi:hypothetical protein